MKIRAASLCHLDLSSIEGIRNRAANGARTRVRGNRSRDDAKPGLARQPGVSHCVNARSGHAIEAVGDAAAGEVVRPILLPQA